MSAARARRAAERLLAWYAEHRRPLPWRATRDPYAIWVSEVMLQQTRVATVLDAWPRFLARFPDAAALAAADDDALLAAWSGLGYYRRARQLRAAMQQLLAEHGGTVPADPEHFGALPGVGPYTCGAVLSIAHGLALPAIDGNVERVLARLDAVDGDPKSRAAHAAFGRTIAAMHAAAEPAELNQALMELGALVCTPRSPRCTACPLARLCRAKALGRVAELPRRRARPSPREIVCEVLWAEHGPLVLSRRVPPGEANEGQVCLPGPGLPVPAPEGLAGTLRARHGLAQPRLGEEVGRFVHGITRHRIEVRLRAWAGSLAALGRARGLAWRDRGDPAVPWTTVARKAFGRAAKLREERASGGE